MANFVKDYMMSPSVFFYSIFGTYIEREQLEHGFVQIFFKDEKWLNLFKPSSRLIVGCGAFRLPAQK